WDAIKQIHRLATLFRNQQRPVIYTRNVYRADKWDMGSWLWKHAPSRPDHASHQAARRSRDDIVDDIAPQATDFVINKQKPSAFFGTPLQSHLTLLGVDSLVVVG